MTISFMLVSCCLQSSGILFYIFEKQKHKYVSMYIRQLYNLPKNSIHCIILQFIFKVFSNNLFSCLHVITNSDFLFNNWLSSMDFVIDRFSVKHDLQ